MWVQCRPDDDWSRRFLVHLLEESMGLGIASVVSVGCTLFFLEILLSFAITRKKRWDNEMPTRSCKLTLLLLWITSLCGSSDLPISGEHRPLTTVRFCAHCSQLHLSSDTGPSLHNRHVLARSLREMVRYSCSARRALLPDVRNHSKKQWGHSVQAR
jgi:hypothetical protein